MPERKCEGKREAPRAGRKHHKKPQLSPVPHMRVCLCHLQAGQSCVHSFTLGLSIRRARSVFNALPSSSTQHWPKLASSLTLSSLLPTTPPAAQQEPAQLQAADGSCAICSRGSNSHSNNSHKGSANSNSNHSLDSSAGRWAMLGHAPSAPTCRQSMQSTRSLELKGLLPGLECCLSDEEEGGGSDNASHGYDGGWARDWEEGPQSMSTGEGGSEITLDWGNTGLGGGALDATLCKGGSWQGMGESQQCVLPRLDLEIREEGQQCVLPRFDLEIGEGKDLQLALPDQAEDKCSAAFGGACALPLCRSLLASAACPPQLESSKIQRAPLPPLLLQQVAIDTETSTKSFSERAADPQLEPLRIQRESVPPLQTLIAPPLHVHYCLQINEKHLLGFGSTGCVYMGQLTLGADGVVPVAVKVLSDASLNHRQLFSEARGADSMLAEFQRVGVYAKTVLETVSETIASCAHPTCMRTHTDHSRVCVLHLPLLSHITALITPHHRGRPSLPAMCRGLRLCSPARWQMQRKFSYRMQHHHHQGPCDIKRRLNRHWRLYIEMMKRSTTITMVLVNGMVIIAGGAHPCPQHAPQHCALLWWEPAAMHQQACLHRAGAV
eukprot:1146926-Pelagomonas_calceolata.AAC.7